MSGERYPVRSVIDMARIPPQAWGRLASELPAMLACVAPLVALYDGLRETGQDVPDEAYDALIRKMDWIDDDKGTATVSMKLGTDDGEIDLGSAHFSIRDGAA